VGNWVNWLLVIGGVICVIIELAMGAMILSRKTRNTSCLPTPAW